MGTSRDTLTAPLGSGEARAGGAQVQALSEAGHFAEQEIHPRRSWRRSEEDGFVLWRGDSAHDVAPDWASSRTEFVRWCTDLYQASLPRRNTL